MALRYIPEGMSAELTKSRQTQPAVAAVDAGLEMRIWLNEGLPDAGCFMHKPGDPGIVYALAFLDGAGNRLAYGGSRASGILSLRKTGQLVVKDDSVALPEGIRALAVDRNFDRLLIATRCKERGEKCTQPSSWTLDLHSESAGRPTPLPKDMHTDGQWAAAIDPAGTTFVTAGWDKRVVVWKLHDWGAPVLLKTLDSNLGHLSPMLSAAIHPVTGEIATGTKDGTVLVWRESASGLWSATLLLDTRSSATTPSPIWALAYSPDGNRLIAGDDNGFLWICDINKDGTVSRCPQVSAHQGAVFAIKFGSNDTMATGGSDGLVYLWTGNPLDRRRLRLDGPSEEVMSIAISASGNLLAAGDTTGVIHFWALGLDGLIQHACSKMRRNLSWAEWKNFMGDDEYECTCPTLPPGRGVSVDKLSKNHQCQIGIGESYTRH